MVLTDCLTEDGGEKQMKAETKLWSGIGDCVDAANCFSFFLFSFFFFSPPTATAQYNHVSSCGSALFSQYKSESRSHILIDRQSERDQT